MDPAGDEFQSAGRSGDLVESAVESAIVGTAMICLGLRRRGWLGYMMAIGGGFVVYRALRSGQPMLPPEKAGDGPHESQLMQGVDEASWESFPASDPPALSPARYFGM